MRDYINASCAAAWRRRSVVKAGAGVFLAATAVRAWSADDYPSKPIRLILGFPPGSGTDFIGRVLEPKLAKALGQPIVVDNKPGASGVLAATMAVSAPGDGYTMVMTVPASTSSARAMLGSKLRYSPESDLLPVGLIGFTSLALIVPASSSVRTFANFDDLVRRSPRGLNVASYGIGSPSHFALEMLKTATQLPLTHVPFAGSAAAMIALQGGQVQACIDSVAGALPQIQSGQVFPLAVTSKARLSRLPAVPTFVEMGLPVDIGGWAGLHVPKGTPQAVILKLNRALNSALENPEVEASLADRLEVAGGPPTVLATLVRDETVKLEKIIAEANIKFD